jgi:hypothetical protein
MRIARTRQRKKQGQSSTELAAALMLIIPLLITGIYLMAESVQAYLIYCQVKQASARAARAIAMVYVQNPVQARDHWFDICSTIEFPGVVNSYKQFEMVGMSETTIPPTVTIKVLYQPDQFGCKHFPDPDLLGLGRYFTISAQSTEKLD